MNHIDKKVIENLLSWVECLCCVPITIYGVYLKYNSLYDPILDPA